MKEVIVLVVLMICSVASNGQKQYSYGGTTYTVYKHHVVMKGLINGTGRTPNGVLVECPYFIIKSKNDSVYVERKRK